MSLQLDRNRQAHARAGLVRRPIGPEAERDQLHQLLDVHEDVLRLVASGADLATCLGEIVDTAGRLGGGLEFAVVALAPACHELAGFAATAGAPGQDEVRAWLAARAEADGAALPLGRCGQSAVMACHSIDDHAGQPLGLLLKFGQSLPGLDPRVLDSLRLLIRSAIESSRRTHALLAANERFAALAKSVPGVVYQRVVRPNGEIRYTYISDAAIDLFGVTPEEIISDPQALFDCHDPEYYATFRDRLLAASRDLKLWDVEATIVARDGRLKYTHAIARPHREPDGSVIWNGVILDQTRIKQAELAAAAASARTRSAIIESIPQAFALYDADDHLITWNRAFVGLYPELAELIRPGAAYADLLRAEIEHGIDQLPDAVAVQDRLYERLACHHLGDSIMERRLANGRWILVNEHHTSDGGTVVLHTDITELKEREAALARSNRELEAFASIASHDLQEPLRKVDSFGDRLKRKYHDRLDDDGRLYIERMQDAVNRMRCLINDLLDYSRVTTKAKAFQPVKLDEVLQQVVSDLEIRIEQVGGRIDCDGLPVLDADYTQMRQLFQNLLANALKFHRPGVPPLVEIRVIEDGSAEARTRRRCHIQVRDNGIGFDMKYADRIFGIFQRLHTRAEYEGTGVGLATCRKIVERHEGEIEVRSEPNVGTTFTIKLPLRQPGIKQGAESHG